ncbi:MAG: oligosaccharide flippase family protein [Betaproteobacteria bacterium]
MLRKIGKFSLLKALVSGSAWSLFAGVAMQIGLFISTLLVNRTLGTYAFGQFSLVTSTINFFVAVAGLGISTAVIRYSAELKDRDPNKLRRVISSLRTILLITGSAATAILIVISAVSPSLFGNREASFYIALASPAAFFFTMDIFYKSILIGFSDLRSFAISAAISSVVSVPILYFSAIFFGLSGIVISIPVTALIQLKFTKSFAQLSLDRFSIGDLRGFDESELSLIVSFLIPTFLAGIASSTAPWLVQMLLARTSNGVVQVGIFNTAFQWFNLIMFFPVIYARVISPILTEFVTSHQKGSTRKFFLSSIFVNAIFALPASIVIASLSANIMSFYSIFYAEAKDTLVIVAVAGLVAAVQGPVSNLLVAQSRMWLGAAMNFLWAAVYVIFAALFSNFGARGVAGALLIAYIIHSVWGFMYSMNALRAHDRGASRL